MSRYLFFILLFLLFFALHFLFYSRVIQTLLVSENMKRSLTALFIFNFFLNILYVIGTYWDIIPKRFYYISSLSLGITLVLFFYLFMHEILKLFYTTLKQVDLSKRAFIKNSADGVMLGVATSYVTVAAYEGSKEPIVNVVHLGKFDFSIVQISDLHIGGLVDKAFLKASVERINALNPDIVCLTGDIIDSTLESIKEIILELNQIHARYGIYYILGNHEYFHNPEEIIAFIRQTKITLLLNDHIQIDALKVNIVGITDYIGYRINRFEPDVHRAFYGCNANYRTIFLAHQPKCIDILGPYSPELILSGHTHGGQIWPFGYLVRLQQPYLKGLHKLPNGNHIYVNSGTGFWGPPMRLGSQAEISYIV